MLKSMMTVAVMILAAFAALPATAAEHQVQMLNKGPDGPMAFEPSFLKIAPGEPGTYGFECKPHYGMGMVGVVIVGNPVNLVEAKAVPQKGKARKRFEVPGTWSNSYQRVSASACGWRRLHVRLPQMDRRL